MRWPLGGRKRGRPVLPTRHPASPAAPPTQALPPQPGPGQEPAASAPRQAAPPIPAAPAPRVPAPPPAEPPTPPPPPPAASAQPTAAARPGPAAVPPPPSAQPAGDGNAKTATPEPPKERPPADPAGGDDRPATLGDVRSLRRWLAVTAIWAVAATAIAVLAYLTANDDDAQQLSDSGSQARRVQRQVNAQLREIQGQVSSAPSAQTVKDLQSTLQDVQKLIAKRDRQAQGFDQRFKALSAEVDTLQQTTQDLQQQAEANQTP